MDGQSLNLTEDLIFKLKQLVPQAFSEGKLDLDQLSTLLGEDVSSEGERYQLTWPGKSEAYKVLQQPTTATLIPQPEDSINWEEAENIFIEGENLEVLKVLQKSYYGKVKMIYIDPPYNTGSDSFIYPDKFSETKEEYLRRIGDKDDAGYMMKEGMFQKNSKENGQFHSNWLNMMLPRIFLARNLLKDDGIIFVSIDDNEQANLKLLMDEVFGEENFVTTFIWEKRTNRENRKMISSRHDYILCYCKNIDQSDNVIKMLPMSEEALARYKNPDNDPRGLWKSDPASAQAGHGTKNQFYTLTAPNGKKHELQSGRCWVYTENVMAKAIKEGRIWFGKDGNGVPRIKTYLNAKERGLVPETIIFAEQASTNESSKKYLKGLFGGKAIFETPKPFELIEVLIKMASIDKGDIILDFFAGSASTAEAVIRQNKIDNLNRKFICIQLPEKTVEGSIAKNEGFDSISEIGEARIKMVIEKIKADRNGKIKFATLQSLGFRKFTLETSNFKIWRGDTIENEEELKEQMGLFVQPQRANALTENILWELLVKSGIPLSEKIEISELEDGTGIYHTSDNKIAFILEKYTSEVQKRVLELKPNVVICLDSLFEGSDKTKTNAQLKFEDSGISFKTV